MEQLRLADRARRAQRREAVVVYFIDLDGFKGAPATRSATRSATSSWRSPAARLRAVSTRGRRARARRLAPSSSRYKLTPQDDAGALRLGERLIEAASERAIFEGRSVTVGASVGIATSPRDAATADDVTRAGRPGDVRVEACRKRRRDPLSS